MAMNGYSVPAPGRNQTANTKVAAAPSSGKGMSMPPAPDKTMKKVDTTLKTAPGFGGKPPSMGNVPEQFYNNLKPSPGTVAGFTGNGLLPGKI
jgi:hypothetical protein